MYLPVRSIARTIAGSFHAAAAVSSALLGALRWCALTLRLSALRKAAMLRPPVGTLVLLALPSSLVRRQMLLRLILLLLLLSPSRRFGRILRCFLSVLRPVSGAAAPSAVDSASLPSSASSTLPLLSCQLLSASLLLIFRPPSAA
jgi:hypothetical protein